MYHAVGSVCSGGNGSVRAYAASRSSGHERRPEGHLARFETSLCLRGELPQQPARRVVLPGDRAAERLDPLSRARSARRRSSARATPRRCQSSATMTATSASVPSGRRLVPGDGHDLAVPHRGEGLPIAMVQVDQASERLIRRPGARVEEPTPDRPRRQSRVQTPQPVDTVEPDLADREPLAVRELDRALSSHGPPNPGWTIGRPSRSIRLVARTPTMLLSPFPLDPECAASPPIRAPFGMGAPCTHVSVPTGNDRRGISRLTRVTRGS